MSEVCYPKIPIHVETEFEVDAHGVCKVLTNVYTSDEDDYYEQTAEELTDILDSLVDQHSDTNGYQQMYCIAHEFSRFAEVLRDKAGKVEDSDEAVADLFNLPDV